ncbi:MAG: tetratricopeptide repeat protein [Bryobacterales bacterium]|nr:tetratricopeptide repeat protein [Bryobacterales bacterium]
MMRTRLARITALLFLVLLVNSFYLAAFAAPAIFYMTNVLAHIGLGLLAAVLFVWWLATSPEFRARVKWAMTPLLVSALLGLVLVKLGAIHSMRWVLWAHIAAAFAGALLVVLAFRSRLLTATFTAGAAACVGLLGYQALFPPVRQIANTLRVPVTMEEEGGGPATPFWPSSSKTNVGGTIPSKFFMDSKMCGECHKEIYEQWDSSMHHFSSFNNQFYRKAIEHMQEISGTQGSKWCAGCHDHAVFFNGRFETPMKDQIDTPEALNGLGCVSCHSITHVEGSMGNGGFTIEYPPLHDLASSHNPYLHSLARYLTFTDPEPHRRTFMKPFMKNSAEFCSACHKVHLDVPVNNYRWQRGFNDYDNWQASGVSGQGARSFYYPPESTTCSGCHMPLVKAPTDPAARNGMVHSHRFPAANTAVATANEDSEQLKTTEEFLKSGFISVDIFSASPAEEAPGLQMLRRASESQTLSSTMAVGEEGEQTGQFFLREVGKVAAPVDRAGAKFVPGSTVRVDVVVRTRKIGHFFPGGTIDAFDVWLELQGQDATGRTIFWSGTVEDGGKGPVEPGAHFYRTYLLDGAGNPVNKRNAWQARSLFYVRLIPPGAADVAHYRVKIPKDAKGPITLTARLNHRKFSHYYTQFSYAGTAKAAADPSTVSVHYDSRQYSFDPANIPKNVAGKIKDRIPDLPITVLAAAEAKLELGSAAEWKPVVRKADRERWNDWGIGLLLQGDLKGAQYAFERVTEAEPEYADGWLNVARALIQEGETEAAKQYIDKAMSINSSLGRIYFFKSQVLKADGDYDGAAAALRVVLQKYPRDRVALNQLGRVLFLKREYKDAAATLNKVLLVDPEDLQAHYNLMLCYRGLGDTAGAAREERLFRRFKADESAQTITFTRRMVSPEDNNERQQIHEHESVTLK